MEPFAALLVIAAIALVVAGPIAVILAIVLFNKLDGVQRRLDKLEGRSMPGVDYPTSPVSRPVASPEQVRPEIIPSPPPQAQVQPTQIETSPVPTPEESTEVAAAMKTYSPPPFKTEPEGGWELKIGTTVALIVGVITVIFGVGFFLKYLYDNLTLSKEFWISMVAVSGFVAIGIGELLRRRNFEIVAKGIAALGFVLLYAAVFSGNHYELFDIKWAFALSIVVTVVAMAYAVGLDEVLIAFLSLLGGYLTPVIISTGQNLPMPLFSYVLVLSIGAMGCAMFRRWRAVNWVAMVGTYLLYTAWFERFYDGPQMATALGWLGVFGGIYLVLPIANGLMKKLTARAEDTALVVANSVAVFYHLWRILYAADAKNLAFAAAMVAAAHFVMMIIVVFRCREDEKLQAALGVLGTGFLTVAVPLYYTDMQPMVIAWAVEAVALTFIGVYYRSMWIRVMSAIVAAVATAGLFYHMPLHESGTFTPILNAPFGTAIFVGLSIMACHGIWRFLLPADDEEAAMMAQVYFVWGRLLLATIALLEWYAHCDWHIEDLHQSPAWFRMGAMLIASVLCLGFFARPLCPRGTFVRAAGIITAFGGAIYTAAAMFHHIYYADFTLFLNAPFGFACLYVAVLLASAAFLKRTQSIADEQPNWAVVASILAMVLLWVLLSTQIYSFWYCKDAFGPTHIENWRFTAQMYMSVSWAAYAAVLLIVGFIARARSVRYLSLLIFAVLLAKIFIIDTATLRTEYRITAFITTGLVLVGVSFLYQMLKKKGFFDAMEKQIKA